MDKIHYKETPYGFEYGAAKIERACSHKKYVTVVIQSKKHWLDITITPSGLIRVGKVEKKTK